MPQNRALDDLVPWPDTRERSVHQDETADAVGVLRSEGIAHHVADVMRHKIGFVD